MKNERTLKILIAIPTSGNDGQLRMQGIFRYLREHSAWDIRLIRSRIDFTAEVARQHITDRIDGAIIAMPNCDAAIETLAAAGIPMILMSKSLVPPKSSVRILRIIADNHAIGRAAAEFFLSLGRFESFAYVPDTFGNPWSVNRGAGFGAALRKFGGVRVFRGTSTDPELRTWPSDELIRFLSDLPKPTAVFAANDNYARQVLAACQTAKIAVPSQTAVLGVDNDALIAEHTSPPLSSIEPEFLKSGYLAAEWLNAIIRNRRTKTGEIHIGIHQLVERSSTSFLSPSSKLVSDAMRLIEQDPAEIDNPAQLARELHVSRNLLDLRFAQLLNKSPAVAIREAKLELVKQLLAETDLSISTITGKAGFKNENSLKNIFRHSFGLSMRTFRRSNRSTGGK